MALSLSSAALGFAPAQAVRAPVTARAAAPVMETLDDLKALAPKLNPFVGYWNPLGLGEEITSPSGEAQTFAVGSQEAAIGFIRHAEIKHGRVAMAAFVGFIVGENGIHFPWTSTLSGLTYADIASAGGACAQWDALPTAAKLQIIGVIGLLEFWGEFSGDHYMRGGVPGKYPSFGPLRDQIGQPTLDLFDPFGFSKKATPEKKERGLLCEINNGRAAMLGIMGFVSAAQVEGSVPVLAGKIAHYDGQVMAPFAAGDASLPFVSEMLKYPSFPLSGFLLPGM